MGRDVRRGKKKETAENWILKFFIICIPRRAFSHTRLRRPSHGITGATNIFFSGEIVTAKISLS
jgi:hypothetical protein